MATRNLLHLRHIDEFKKWLESEGWVVHPTKGIYEAIRAKKDSKWIIVYQKDGAKEHFSVRDADNWIVRKFYRVRRAEDGR